MKVLGIDPGYDRLGVAIVEKSASGEAVLFSTCITTNSKNNFNQRLVEAVMALEKIITVWQPDHAAIETLFFSNNQKTAMRVAEMRGAISYAVGQRGIKIEEINPQEIKVAITGDGRATKEQVNNMTCRLVKLDDTPRLDDEIDAIAIALTLMATALIHKVS